MKKTLLLAGVATALLVANVNAAEFKPYVAVKALYTDVDSNMDWAYSDEYGSEKESYDVGDKGWGASLAIGVSNKLSHGAVRAELEFSQKADADSSYTSYDETFKNKIQAQTLMLNAYYDIDTGTKLTPYVGAGIGYAKLEAKDEYWNLEYGKSIDKNNFAWQIGVGAAYNLTNNVSLDAGYRYIDYGNLSSSEIDDWGGHEKAKVDLTANEFYIGARYMF